MVSPEVPAQKFREFVSLGKAFQRLGQALFGSDWRDDCIVLSPGWLRDELADEAPIIPDPNDPERTMLLRQRGIPIASHQMVECYETTRDKLLDALWSGRVLSLGIARNGFEMSVPRQAWKDRTGVFRVSIADSEVIYQADGSLTVWEIKLDATTVSALIKLVENKRQSRRRKEASKKYPKGGRPTTHNWDYILGLADAEYRSKNPPASIRECARRVQEKLRQENKAVPGDSHLRDRISKYRRD